jgi:hypothetical protein
MPTRLTARDLWPLIEKLSQRERVRLIAMVAAMRPGSDDSDVARYLRDPVAEGEFEVDQDSLAWDAAGWEEFDAPR